MGAGYITAACAIVRTALSGQILEKDVTYAMVPNAAWRATEVNLGIICANAPILRPLYLWWKGRLQRKQSKRSGTSYVATNELTGEGSDGTGGKSKVRLWPGAKFYNGSGSGKSKGMSEATQASGYTETSAELGLPIEGYMMGDRKSAATDKSGEIWMDETMTRVDQQKWKPLPGV